MSELPSEKEIMLAVLGSTTALAGLLLVFLGFVASTYRSYPGGTPDSVLRKYRKAANGVVLAFFLCLAGVLLAFVWLLTGGGSFYWANACLFAVEIGLVFAAAVNILRLMMF